MKSHDWIFLMFTTIICCMTIITIAQAQQRGRVKFGVSMQKDDVDTNASPEVVNVVNQARGSTSHRGASSRFRAPIPSAIPSTIEEIKESPRSRGSRGRSNDRSSRKLTAEATEVIPLVRSRKRINPIPPPQASSDQPTKIELPTSSIDRTNVIRRSKTRSEPSSSPSSTSPPSPSAPSESVRRRSDVPPSSDKPTEGIRKVRTFTSRSVTKQADEVISSENPLNVATTGSSWRNVAMKRGASKLKSSERKSKALDEDQLEDENYPEHFKLLLRKQQPSAALLPKNYPKLPIQEDPTYSKINEIYEAPRAQGRLRRIEQANQEPNEEILQVSRAVPKVRRVELKREDTARAALKTRRVEPRLEENKETALKIEGPSKSSRRSDAEKLRAQVKINKAATKTRKNEPSNEVQREDIQKVPSKSNRRSESSTEENQLEVKPNEIEESTKGSKTLFSPRRAEPYRPKPKTTTQRPTTTSKPIKKPEVLAARAKFKNRFNSRLQFPSLRTKSSSTSDEVVKYDNEVVQTSPAPQPSVRPLQITKSRNLALDRPVVEARPKPKQQKFSSRYRGDAFSRYQQKTEPSKPIYTPTIPALTTEPIPPQLEQVTAYNLEKHQDLNKSGANFEGIVFDGTAGVWNMVEPVAGGLTRSEISVESGAEEQPLAQSSVTVSIFEALADILSKTPSTTTSTTTTTTTSTTTTSTTELPDIIQENAVLLDLLKRKYIKSDLPSRSSNVVSLTTVRNVIEESSIPANKEEDVSENTLFDSSEEKKKDSIDDLFLTKGSVVPNRNNNNDDENVISKQFDTSYANVGIGSIFAGNKELNQVDRKTTPTIYLVTPVSVTTTTEVPTTLTTTTPSTTTTTTTPSTTTTSSTTESTTTTTTTTTPIPTTTSTTTTTTTTTTPMPIILEVATTPKPTIIFQAPSSTSGTIVSPQGPAQTNTALLGANNELEKNIKLLEQLLQLQASLKSKPSSSSSTTTTTTSTPSSTTAKTKAIGASTADDEQFINQLRQLLLIQQQATKKPTTSSTTTTSTTTTTPRPTTSTTTKPITISPQNLQDLLNSFSTPSFTSTTARPVTNLNDIEFLNSLREIGKIQVTTSAPTTFANRIIELALKNRPAKPTSPVYISTTVPPFVPIPDFKFPQILPSNEVEKHRQDEASLSADLSLLSTLLGRRITIADLPSITQQFGGNRGKPAPIPVPKRTTTTTTTPRTTRTTPTTTQRPMTRDEVAEIEKNLNLLSSLLGRQVSLNELPLIMQDLRAGRKPKGTASSGATINIITPAPFKTTTTARPRPNLSLPSQTPISQEEVIELLKDPSLGSPDQLNIYGQSNDAILAAVLKQRGIGPAHNNLPINNLFGQEQTQKPYRPSRPQPPPPPPQPQRRPVLDGLAWLWRTWQDTASPGNRVSKNNRQPTASASTRLESPILLEAFAGDAPAPTVVSNEGGEYADLQYPRNPPSFGQGNGLLTAAFGVTRAVSQFLGAAFQGAAKSVQSAFSPQAIQQPSLLNLSG